MTPTEQDKELEKNILYIIEAHFKPSDNSLMPLNATKRVMQLITADRKRVALEARLDELKTIRDNYETQNTVKFGTVIRWSDITDRIAELEAQQEEL